MPTIKKAKTICITSTKGGVGKTTTVLNLAGIYSLFNKRVLIIDLDLYGGGIAVSLNVDTKKTVFNLVDDMMNNRFTRVDDYIYGYNDLISIIGAPKDPRQASKIDSKYIDILLYNVESKFDVILIDTTHILDNISLAVLDRCDENVFIVTNDPVCLKNTKNIVAIFKDNEIENYKMLYNGSRDTGKDEFTLFDIKQTIKTPVNYAISKAFYIKEIDKYVLEGEILLLNKAIQKSRKVDFGVFKKIAEDLIYEKNEEVIIRAKENNE